ncbi:ATP-binding protein [Streptacidiphilus sp. PB12-B1b]|uniref:ATP-binding protein n=1 Tax=Streptacidiphilus sp. PB12-B1b TaxID=2705012 RepID=UPI0015FE0DEC|nr:ATP-binding protein [Streptacidiphilus sp. PB12-B1b]QMU75187.1 ATP-binding protein [Streptacidiphilus sp. PB12-B1b]
MSLPLSRRIAQAAFVVAAGAVPAVLAGSASAASMLPAVPDLGAVSQPDGGNLGGNLQNATHQTGQLAGAGASSTVGAAVPAVADATGATASKALPATDGVVGGATRQLGQVTGNPTGSLGGVGGLTRSMPAPAGVSLPAAAPAAAPSSPLSSLPLAGSLPLNQVGGLSGAATGAAPAQRLGGLPGLGDTSGLTNGLGGLGGLTHGLPVGV